MVYFVSIDIIITKVTFLMKTSLYVNIKGKFQLS